MKRFLLAKDFYTRVFDAYDQYATDHSSAVFQYVDQKQPLFFEEIAMRVQRDGCDGYKPGQTEIAHGLLLLVQAGLVEVV